MAVKTKPAKNSELLPILEEAVKTGNFRDRVLQYVAEGPHFTQEEAEEIRRMLREAREEDFGSNISA